MHHDELLFIHGETVRLHHAAALGSPIARVHIHMLAPQTLRTMVRISVSLNEKPALFAGKILFSSLKFRGHEYALLTTVIQHLTMR